MVKTRTQKLQEQIEELKEENEELKEQNEELYDYEGAIVCLGLIDGDEYDKVVAQNKKLTEENKKLTKERDTSEYHAELVSQEAEREVGREHKRYLEEHKRYLEEHESYLEMGATCEREVGIEHERYLETQFQFSEKLWEVCQELDIENNDKSENIIKEIKKLKEEIEELKEGHSLIYKSLRKAEGVKELMTGPEFECIAEAVGDYIQGFHEKDEKIEELKEQNEEYNNVVAEKRATEKEVERHRIALGSSDEENKELRLWVERNQEEIDRLREVIDGSDDCYY